MKFIRFNGALFNVARMDKIEFYTQQGSSHLSLMNNDTSFYRTIAVDEIDCEEFMNSFSHFLESDSTVFDVEKELKSGFYLKKEGEL